jgi:hypothetical protein
VVTKSLHAWRFRTKLKKLYRDISHLETKLLADSGEAQDENRIIIKGGPSKTRWKNLNEIDDLVFLHVSFAGSLAFHPRARIPAELRVPLPLREWTVQPVLPSYPVRCLLIS